MKIPISKPYFGKEEAAAIGFPLETGWVVQGPHVKKFEEKFSAITKSPYCAATSSCTTALHIAVAALGLKPGDEVIVPSFTWIATANVVEYMGAKPVFCDIELNTFNLDVAQLEKCITPRTVGIIPVHLFGLMAPMPAVMDIARKHKLWVVEDAACGFGAAINGKHAGVIGDVGCFSFHPRKSVTTGEGGMLTTDNLKLDVLFRSLRDHGASLSDLERHENKKSYLLPDYALLGYNFRMTDFQGALGCVQLDRAEWILKQRRSLAKKYDDRLSNLPWLRTPLIPAGYTHGYQAYVCLFSPETLSFNKAEALRERRNKLMTDLEDQGIATRQGTHAPVFTAYYRKKYGFRPDQFPNAFMAEALTLSLPLFPQLQEDEHAFVCDALLKAKV